jgi:hypothetical protein
VRWYLGVRCRKCRTPILFALDRSEGTGQTAPVSTGKLVLTCAIEDCKHQADYTAAAVSRFQKQSANSPKMTEKHEGKENRKRKRRP